MEIGNLGLVGRQLRRLSLLFINSSINLKAQETKSICMGYKLIASKEGIAYLERNNKNVQDLSKTYLIPSKYGSIYELSNGEVLLLHLRGNGEYPGFIFDNYESFKQCCDNDFFPIGEKDMTWLELHAGQMKLFLQDSSFYVDPLVEKVQVDAPFNSSVECEGAYQKLKTYIGKNDVSNSQKIAIAHCYALAVIKFLISKKGFKWHLEKRYEIYNPYYIPIVINSVGNKEDIFSDLFMAINSEHSSSFRTFYWYASGTPIHVNLD